MGRPFLPGRGRRSFADAPGGGSYGEKWHQKLEYLDKPKNPEKPKEIRIVGGVFTLNQHFIKFKKKDGGTTGWYEVCPDFDPLTGEFRTGADAVCPICRDFSDPEYPEDLKLFGSFRYYFDAFDISAGKAGANTGVFGVVWVNKYGRNDLVKISGTMDEPIDDLNGGCSIWWYNNDKTRDAKERSSFSKGDPIVVKYSESKGLYGVQVVNKRGKAVVLTGEPTPFDEIVEVKSPDKIARDLKRVGLYDRLDEYLQSIGRSRASGASSRASSNSGTKIFGDEDDSPAEEAAPAADIDDFDFGSDADAPEAPPQEAESAEETVETPADSSDFDDDFFGESDDGGEEEPSAEEPASEDDDASFDAWEMEGGDDAETPDDPEDFEAGGGDEEASDDTSSDDDDDEFGGDW